MNTKRVSIIVFVVSLVVVVASVGYTTFLTKKLEQEEQKKMAIWAEATRLLILADENTDIDFYTSIIEDNTTIPVYMTDAQGTIILSRNADANRVSVEGLHGPIEVRISDEIVQYIYYDDSILLHQLYFFPYIQLALILIFLVIGLVALIVGLRNEQNRLWVGLSKETAHQLGTPISSLNAWIELLRVDYPENTMLDQMQVDITRLHTIADRFSKVGSVPELSMQDISVVLSDSVSYMRSRVSNKVSIIMQACPSVELKLSRSLFEWVIENLIRNAVDAMDGSGTITIAMTQHDNTVVLDVTDTGKGMSHREQQRAFQPGYTTKKRGWGLGLSLSKRIVEDYHRGKIFIQSSEPGHGTTFRIILKKPKDGGTAA